MTRQEISHAVEIAKSDKDLTGVSQDHLFGCGLSDFKPVVSSIDAVAVFLRWQCCLLTGGFDETELNNLYWIMQHRIRII
jgi:hypothetical protein